MNPPNPEHILQIGLGFWSSKALLSAVELGVFTTLAEGPLPLEALRQRLGLHQRAAHDFFDALVALGLLERNDGRYHNTSTTDLFLDKEKPTYLGGILEMANSRLYPFWNHLSEALRTGEKQNEAKHGGEDFFSALYAEPRRLSEFLHAMSGISRPANLAIAANFPWGDHATIADIGTAQGDLAVQVARANPHLRGFGFDLPEVQPTFDAYVERNGLADRLSFSAGDFFRDPLPQVDVLMMGHILHDWSLEQKRELIAKAYTALPAGGALIVYDAIIDDQRTENAFGLLMSLNMLIETEAGFDYTGGDCCGWMIDAGFRETRVEHLVGPDSMVIGIK